jgi:hypothetical protein
MKLHLPSILIHFDLYQATSVYKVLIHRRMPSLSEAQQPLLSKIAEVDQWVGDKSDRHWAKYVFYVASLANQDP